MGIGGIPIATVTNRITIVNCTLHVSIPQRPQKGLQIAGSFNGRARVEKNVPITALVFS